MQSETCRSKRIFFWLCLTLLMSLQIAPLHCSYIDPKALYLGEIPTARDGRIVLLRHNANLWWAKKAHPKCKWPQVQVEINKEQLSPYKDPLSLYLSLSLLPKIDQKLADQICYIAIPKELKLMGIKGSDRYGHYASYEEAISILREIGDKSLEHFLATAHYKKQLNQEYSSWKVVDKHFLPKGSLHITKDLPLLWLRQRLQMDVAKKAIALDQLPLTPNKSVDRGELKKAQAVENLIYALIDHEQFSSKNPPHLLMLPSEDSNESLERWHSLLTQPSLFIGGYGKDSSSFFSMLQRAPQNPDLYLQLKEQMRSAYDQLRLKDKNNEKEKTSPDLLTTPSIKLPSLWQLELASMLESLPSDIIAACLFATALVTSLFARGNPIFRISFIASFSWLTLILCARIIALERPPVSNMYETLLYVPWVIALASIIAGILKKPQGKKLRTPVSAAILGCMLFSLSIDVERALMPAIAVLNSSFWLTTHVLLVVGSYGILLLASALSHRDLFLSFARKDWEEKTRSSRKTALILVQWGTSALVVGTLLGGVWAAQSWGRFWDWDPKESWALITSAYYLILIHLSRFYPISAFLFSIINAAGALFITFTWYGVNYILGAGLHSYGFGSDSHLAYGLYVASEVLFLTVATYYEISRLSLPKR